MQPDDEETLRCMYCQIFCDDNTLENGGFVMMRGRGAGGQAPDLEEDSEDKQDPAEVLADYFHETMSNLAWLATADKI